MVPVCKHLRSKKVLVLYMVVFWNVFYQYYWWSPLAVELKSARYGASETTIGFVYLLRSLFFFPPAFFVPLILDKLGNVKALLIANIVHFFSQIFLGPSELLGLYPNLYLVGTGMAFMGLIGSLHFAPVFPEIIKDFQANNPQYQVGPISDVVSAIGNMVVEIGAISGSVLGMIFSTQFTFRTTVDIFLLAQIPMLVAFVLWSGIRHEPWPCCNKSKRVKPGLDVPASTSRVMKVDVDPIDEERGEKKPENEQKA